MSDWGYDGGGVWVVVYSQHSQRGGLQKGALLDMRDAVPLQDAVDKQTRGYMIFLINIMLYIKQIKN
ncbi:jg4205 [Pararge aegeria aegeria]|uniref:Jg4205 protein n=1 Tax=Pararge aegeria aegeria TaxID=348720 RepID=A0A8S4R844_9NEOP|nr:jg4205 [Pararge aegeria aegeria]